MSPLDSFAFKFRRSRCGDVDTAQYNCCPNYFHLTRSSFFQAQKPKVNAQNRSSFTMPERSSIIRKKFFLDYTNPNAVVEPPKSIEVDAILGNFSLDSEEPPAIETNFWTSNLCAK